MSSSEERGPIAPQVISILMLLWALNPANPYGYYVLLRIVLCGVSAFLAYRAYELGKESWVWILGLTAVIYNPLIRIHLTREIWTVINLATIVVLAITFRTLRQRSAGEY